MGTNGGTMNTRIKGLRDRLSERTERDRYLVKAVCRVCGEMVPVGEGTRDLEPPFVDARSRQERDLWLRSLPAEVDGWRRLCGVCATALDAGRLEAHVVASVLGLAVSEVSTRDGRDVLAILRRPLLAADGLSTTFAYEYPTAEVTKRFTGKSWGHVTDADREKVRAALETVLSARTPGPCTDGACGFCGRREAVVWHPSPLTWPDGSRAPICDVCTVVWLRRGEPRDIDGMRRVGVELSTGFPVPFGYEAPSEFRLYAETRDCDGNGQAEPWTYGEGITRFREQAWTARPELAPEDRRHEFHERHEEVLRARREEVHRENEQRAAVLW